MDSTTFNCDTCEAKFTVKSNLMRHKRMIHGQRVSYVCDDCGNTFSRQDNLKRHRRNHKSDPKRQPGEEPQFDCSKCKAQFLCKQDLEEHKKTHASPEETYLCRPTSNIIQRKRRGNVDHGPSPKKCLQQHSLTPFELPPHVDPNGWLGEMYKEHWLAIKDRRALGRVYQWYNFHLPTLNNEILGEKAQTVFDHQSTAFKINASYGFVLRNNETEECRYYYASRNTKILDSPMLITNQVSFQDFVRTLQHEDVLEYARTLRPNSKWVVQHITNVKFYIFRLTDHPIGRGIELPPYVQDNQSIISLIKNRDKGQTYNDRLCLFRCIALYKGCDSKGMERVTKSLYRQYQSDIPINDFEGVTLDELHRVEELFEINITVYELATVGTHGEDDGDEIETETLPASEEKIVARLVRRGLEKFPDNMYVNLYKDHCINDEI